MKTHKIIPPSRTTNWNKFFKFNNRIKLLFITKMFNGSERRKKLRNDSREILKQDITNSAYFPAQFFTRRIERNSQERGKQFGGVASRDDVKKVDFEFLRNYANTFWTHITAKLRFRNFQRHSHDSNDDICARSIKLFDLASP